MKSEIAVSLLYTLAAIFAVAAVFIAWAWRNRDDKARIWTTFVLEIAILAGVFVPAYLGGMWLLAAALALGWVAGRELYATLEKGGERPFQWAGIAASIAVVVLGGFAPQALPWTFGAGLVVLAALAAAAKGAPADGAAARALATWKGVVYPGLCLAHAVALGGMEGGFGYLVLCYGLVEVNDSAAFLVGSGIGRRKIFPKLSPNKTLEGSLGGVVATLIVAFALRFAVPSFDTVALVGCAVLLAVGGQAGDLFASRIKRQAGVKDFGDAVPMHGGFLDVYDSFLFTAPLFFYYAASVAG